VIQREESFSKQLNAAQGQKGIAIVVFRLSESVSPTILSDDAQ
jgi:hypothetical protein